MKIRSIKRRLFKRMTVFVKFRVIDTISAGGLSLHIGTVFTIAGVRKRVGS